MSKITDALQKAAQEREKKNELQTKQKEGTLPQGVIDLSSEDYEKLGRNIVFFQNKGGTQAQENFRILRTNLHTMHKHKSILVSSASDGDGKSFVSLNLAVAMAMAGEKVLLVDTHINYPELANMLELNNMPGLVEVLSIGCKWQDAVQQSKVPNLYLMPSGYSYNDHTTELLNSKRMEEMLREWEAEFDFIIIDASPIDGDAGAIMLAPKTGGVLFVAKMNKTSKNAIKSAKSALKKVNANIVGFVLTGIKNNIPRLFSRMIG